MGNNIESEQDSALVRQITSVFCRVLKQPEIKADSDYFLYGGNSLNAMEVLGELEEQTGQLVRVSDLYACRTARRLAQFIGKEEKSGKPVPCAAGTPETCSRYGTLSAVADTTGHLCAVAYG